MHINESSGGGGDIRKCQVNIRNVQEEDQFSTAEGAGAIPFDLYITER